MGKAIEITDSRVEWGPKISLTLGNAWANGQFPATPPSMYLFFNNPWPISEGQSKIMGASHDALWIDWVQDN